jgi:hypothetical protein
MARHDNARTKGKTDRAGVTLPASFFCGQLTSDSRTGAKVLAQFGVCQNALDPYRPSQWQTAPTPAEILAALPDLAGPCPSIPDVETLKAVIASQYVALIGIDVYQSFESDEAAAMGNIPIPAENEQYLGGHEVVPYRFDDNHVNWDKSLGAVGFLNSWGTEWGVKVDLTRKEAGGSGWLPYGYFNTEGLVLNLWTQRLAA